MICSSKEVISGRVPQGIAALFVALSGTRRKGARMAKYFMTGTKYELFERMMMSTDRKGRDEKDHQDSQSGDERKEMRT